MLNDRPLNRKTHVNAHELIAALWAINALRPQLNGKIINLYADNTAAESIIRKGASRRHDLNKIVGTLWLLVADMGAELIVNRVPTKRNPADAPSRAAAPPFGTDDNREYNPTPIGGLSL